MFRYGNHLSFVRTDFFMCISGQSICNQRVSFRTAVLQFSEKIYNDGFQPVQGVNRMFGLSAFCPAYNSGHVPSSVQVREKVSVTHFISLFPFRHFLHNLCSSICLVLYLFFSATWNTSINYSVGMLSFKLHLFFCFCF